MLGPAYDKLLSLEELNKLRAGTTGLSIKSGLGGSYSVRVDHIDEERIIVEITNKDHEHKREFARSEITETNMPLFKLEPAFRLKA